MMVDLTPEEIVVLVSASATALKAMGTIAELSGVETGILYKQLSEARRIHAQLGIRPNNSVANARCVSGIDKLVRALSKEYP